MLASIPIMLSLQTCELWVIYVHFVSGLHTHIHILEWTNTFSLQMPNSRDIVKLNKHSNFTKDAQDNWLHIPHYYTKFNRGGQKGLTEVGKPTASVERSRLIMALTEAVGRPPRLIK